MMFNRDHFIRAVHSQLARCVSPVTARQLAEAMGADPERTRKALGRLEAQQLARRSGKAGATLYEIGPPPAGPVPGPLVAPHRRPADALHAAWWPRGGEGPSA